ncbi:hypothetical protein GQ44DRAFT_719536 [Phaeosphaeriaceae sp. PMI808]|nr:hypothetical protein GQ44DRAFT_719536 [Phaeosphaeriaceae sp. PMI808]
MDPDFQETVQWIGRSWTCKRDPRDTHRDEIMVKEVRKQERIRKGERLNCRLKDFRSGNEFTEIWKTLWPETERGWKEDWRSFPLELD